MTESFIYAETLKDFRSRLTSIRKALLGSQYQELQPPTRYERAFELIVSMRSKERLMRFYDEDDNNKQYGIVNFTLVRTSEFVFMNSVNNPYYGRAVHERFLNILQIAITALPNVMIANPVVINYYVPGKGYGAIKIPEFFASVISRLVFTETSPAQALVYPFGVGHKREFDITDANNELLNFVEVTSEKKDQNEESSGSETLSVSSDFRFFKKKKIEEEQLLLASLETFAQRADPYGDREALVSAVKAAAKSADEQFTSILQSPESSNGLITIESIRSPLKLFGVSTNRQTIQTLVSGRTFLGKTTDLNGTLQTAVVVDRSSPANIDSFFDKKGEVVSFRLKVTSEGARQALFRGILSFEASLSFTLRSMPQGNELFIARSRESDPGAGRDVVVLQFQDNQLYAVHTLMLSDTPVQSGCDIMHRSTPSFAYFLIFVDPQSEYLVFVRDDANDLWQLPRERIESFHRSSEGPFEGAEKSATNVIGSAADPTIDGMDDIPFPGPARFDEVYRLRARNYERVPRPTDTKTFFSVSTIRDMSEEELREVFDDQTVAMLMSYVKRDE